MGNYDLEQRTLLFSKTILDLISKLPKNKINLTLTDQLLRSATSIGANYREANDAIGKRDFKMRIKICRREAKETKYWLDLILHHNRDFQVEINLLLKETTEFIKIFSTIVKKFSI